MTELKETDAVALVRKNLDEQDPNGSAMYTDENGSAAAYGDNSSLDGIIAKNLPEAINAIHKVAPVNLLEGVDLLDENAAAGLVDEGEEAPAISDDGVLSFTLDEDTNYLRLVAFRADESAIVVTDVIPEASPEGRKQLNPYIRGRIDRPRLVQLQGSHSGPSFKYYTIKDTSPYEGENPSKEPVEAIAEFYYIQEQSYPETPASGGNVYDISRRLRQNIIDYLTAKVMETYGDQRSQAYYQKALTFSSL